ncbi:hypothetical protein [Nocardiopsis sp. FR26]|uniref:hypothetical protein n=1 Tax=Nocardiopsis sp. FR26 TaxID=2605987 RepID=UPI00135AA9A9|nr:hypothetical protein [Nocardiopsis sp. FR26]
MSADVFRVSRVVGPEGSAVAKLYGEAAGAVFTQAEPLEVPAEWLTRSGVPLSEVADRRWALSAEGWVPVERVSF